MFQKRAATKALFVFSKGLRSLEKRLAKACVAFSGYIELRMFDDGP